MTTMSTATLPVCDHCGDVAAYQATNDLERRCEACAMRCGYEARGEAYAAMQTLGFAVSMLRGVGVSDDAILGMVREIVSDPHSVGSYPIGGDQYIPGPDAVRNRPWMHNHRPLGPQDAS
jgi:hypothetical protein